VRPDLDIVARLVGDRVNVLDLGCGDGALLEHLIEQQGCQGLGVELDDDDFHGCIARGVPVTHGDLEIELPQIEDAAFDVAVLSLTLQSTSRPDHVLSEMNRVADRMVVSLPNIGHWRRRARLALRGRVPDSGASHENWYDTEKVHACTIADFEELVSHLGLRIRQRVVIDGRGRSVPWITSRLANLLAEGAVYVLSG
jgi:methionine biosynthesis protein MetW